jgi:hypothetical protein
MYVNIGARSDDTEFHVNFTGADNLLGNVAATPLQMLISGGRARILGCGRRTFSLRSSTQL